MSDTVSDTGPVRKGRLRRIAEEEYILVVLLAGSVLIFLLVFPPVLIVNDSWLTLWPAARAIGIGLDRIDDATTVYGQGRSGPTSSGCPGRSCRASHQPRRFALLSIATCLFVVVVFTLAAAASRTLAPGAGDLAAVPPRLISAALGGRSGARCSTFFRSTRACLWPRRQGAAVRRPRLVGASVSSSGRTARERRTRCMLATLLARDELSDAVAARGSATSGCSSRSTRDPRHPLAWPGDDARLLRRSAGGLAVAGRSRSGTGRRRRSTYAFTVLLVLWYRSSSGAEAPTVSTSPFSP